MNKTVMMFALMTVAGAAMASDRNFVVPSADQVHAAVAAQSSSSAAPADASDNAFILGHTAPAHSSK